MSGNLAIWRELPRSAIGESGNVSNPWETNETLGSEGETSRPTRPRSNDTSGTCPTVDLHFNLWRDFETAIDFFDIGIQIAHTDQVRRLLIFVPDRVDQNDVLDLSSLLKHPDSLNAVFNDIVEIADHSEGWFDIEKGPSGAPQKLRLHSIAVGNDLTFEPVAMDGGKVGTLLILGETICRLFADASPSAHYVRFRIKLTGHLRDLFSRDVTPDDWWLLSSFMTTGITEFRLNERRTMPLSVIRRFDAGQLSIATIHYFLIRDLRHELVVQHKDFSKIRTLESDIWKHYLRGRHPVSPLDGRPIRRLGEDRLVIYHWKQSCGERATTIDEFNAFAKFRSPRMKFWIYGIAIALLGAVGSGVHSVLLSVIARSNVTAPILSSPPVVAIGWDGDALLTLGILVVSIAALVALFNRKRLLGWRK